MGNANQYQFQNYESSLEQFSDSVITIAETAEIILDNAIYLFNKEKLMNEIDSALINGKKEKFKKLSKEYNALLAKYKYLKEYKLGE